MFVLWSLGWIPVSALVVSPGRQRGCEGCLRAAGWNGELRGKSDCFGFYSVLPDFCSKVKFQDAGGGFLYFFPSFFLSAS